jgi:hypothetical protein
MYLVCQTCFKMFWDEYAFAEMLGEDYNATIGDLADAACCPECAGDQTACLSSTTYLNKNSSE